MYDMWGLMKCENPAIHCQELLSSLKGLFTNVEYITFFSCLNKINIFYERSISMKTALTRNIWEKWCSKSVRVKYIYDIYNSTRSEWLWAPYFLNCFESELLYRDGPFIKNGSFAEKRNFFYIFNIGEQSL